MDRAGNWVCSVVCGGVRERGVVYGVGEEERVWAVRDLSDCGGDCGVVFCGEVGGIRIGHGGTEGTEKS